MGISLTDTSTTSIRSTSRRPYVRFGLHVSCHAFIETLTSAANPRITGLSTMALGLRPNDGRLGPELVALGSTRFDLPLVAGRRLGLAEVIANHRSCNECVASGQYGRADGHGGSGRLLRNGRRSWLADSRWWRPSGCDATG